ncbi:MAG: Lipid-A-disaccharide synthase [Calditrichaeota bacterium]|nr:Lipid-A-disaccharide synthase [Calditrichota bacterium]
MHVFWITGESSGDRYAAELIGELDRLRPQWTHSGMGGEAMRRAGAEIVADLREATLMGLSEVLGQLPRLFRLRARLLDAIDRGRVQLVVLIDYPDFNLGVARALRRRLGRRVSILYYVSPQVWAWRRYRAKTIARLVDAMAVLFPFELDVYRPHGLETVFFGHPLVGEVTPARSAVRLREKFDLAGDARPVALLPGSREQEVERHLPVQLAAVARVRDRLAEPAPALVARANTVDRALLARLCEGHARVQVVEDSRDALATAHVALVKSGTSTVEALLIGTPYVVMYKVSPITYELARRLIRGVRHIAMVNVLADRELVPECVQDDANPAHIAAELELLWSGRRREEQVNGLAEIAKTLGEPGATRRLAEWVVARFGNRDAC